MPALLFTIAALYLAAGVIFSILFLARGIKKVDALTKNSSFGFRLIIIPGLIVFWPVLMQRWRQLHAKTKPA